MKRPEIPCALCGRRFFSTLDYVRLPGGKRRCRDERLCAERQKLAKKEQ
ncbi:MAG TPA: hypothetical protein VFQ79_24610 [Bryobacteraceae bacterium]|nr:hypothetical protein [Bryobacteraceae bacterium]